MYSGPSATTLALSITGSTFNQFSSPTYGSFLYTDGTSGNTVTISISTSNFNCLSTSVWATWPSTYNLIVTNVQTPTKTLGTAFYMSAGTLGTITTANN